MPRTPQLGPLALSSCVVWATAVGRARAQEQGEVPRSEEPTARIAVLMLPTGELDPAVPDALTELLMSAVVRQGGAVAIVGKEQL